MQESVSHDLHDFIDKLGPRNHLVSERGFPQLDLGRMGCSVTQFSCLGLWPGIRGQDLASKNRSDVRQNFRVSHL